MSHHSTRQFHGYVPPICKPIIDTGARLLLLHVINTCLHLAVRRLCDNVVVVVPVSSKTGGEEGVCRIADAAADNVAYALCL